MTDGAEAPVLFSVTTTLDDTIAVATHLTAAAKPPKPRRAWRGPATLFAFILVGLGSGLVSADNPVEAAKLLLNTSFALQIVTILVVFLTVSWLAGWALRLLNRRVSRAAYADSRRHHPTVDSRDPSLTLARRYRFDEIGMTMSTDFDEIWEAWPRITGLDETKTLLIVRIGTSLGYPLPKAQLADELRERLHLYIAGRSHSKWPF